MRGLFVAATKQHIGKTSVSMALLQALHRIYGKGRVGYMKPVGHRWVRADDGSKVDKDALVAKEYFGISSHIGDMSPVVMTSGYTRRFLDGVISPVEQWSNISEAYERLKSEHDFVVVEGTGHTGKNGPLHSSHHNSLLGCSVGSIVGVSNATVAAGLNIPAVMVANGGVGSTFDELALNRTELLSENVEVKGVIVNKVREEKVEMVKHYLGLALARWKCPLVGCVPYGEGFDTPSLADLELLYDTKMLSGEDSRLHRIGNYELVTTSLGRFMSKLNWKRVSGSGFHNLIKETCVITHWSRVDIILGLLSHCYDGGKPTKKERWRGALLLTGREPELPEYVESYIRASNLPSLKTGRSTAETLSALEGFTAKMHRGDRSRTRSVIELYEPKLVSPFPLIRQAVTAAQLGTSLPPSGAPHTPSSLSLLPLRISACCSSNEGQRETSTTCT
ncbi:unnamed protein product [Chrysoparadoxa australica]